MQQNLVIVRINESFSRMGEKRFFEEKRVPLSKLTAGASIKISDFRKMSVVQLTDEELTFRIDDGRCYTLNRYWQVLGTVKMSCVPSQFVEDFERFAFYFETQVKKPEPGAYDTLTELIDVIRQNANDNESWKNIPLAREIMHLLKDCTPLRDEEIDPTVRMLAVSTLADEDLLSPRNTPRLFLSFYQYFEVCNELKTDQDAIQKGLKQFYNKLYKNLFEFSWTVDPGMTEDLYRRLFVKKQTLRFDFMQLSPEWEKEIYDIEKETSEKLGDHRRGRGFCHSYWSEKAEIAEKHGLHWRSPRVMNPKVRFD